ncbi:MAG: polyphosphate kinase 2 [Gammaproteobacteria bacterium]|jgi:polyphosphate kinase 2
MGKVMAKKKTTKHKKKVTTKVDAYHEDDPRLRGEKEEKLSKKLYEEEIFRLQVELVKLQEWVTKKGLKVAVIFEGRDAAGKGGVIKRIIEHMSPRICNIVALPAPTEREKTQWYFQRYIAHLPAAGKIVLFDRSWYNRAGVERVMGFCTEEEYKEFLRFCPEFECSLVRSGIILIKYWFSVSNVEQERRFQGRALERHKLWKLSPMDMESRSRWMGYSKCKDEMFFNTDIPQAPWYVVPSDDKKRARLNCISHLLDLIPYKDLKPKVPKIPPLKEEKGYKRSAMHTQTFVPKKY